MSSNLLAEYTSPSPQDVYKLAIDNTACAGAHGLEESRERKHVEADSVERGYNESFSVGPEFNRAAEFARKAAEESASANAFSKEAYKRCSNALSCFDADSISF